MKDESFRLPPSSFLLSLADGTRLALCPADEQAARVVAFLAAAAQLTPAPSSPRSLPGVRRLLVTVEGHDTPDADTICLLQPRDVRWRRGRQIEGNGTPAVILEPVTEEQWLWAQLVWLSAAVSRETHPRGGVLLHSGLAAYPDLSGFREANLTGLCGFLLAGRSGVGKTTTSARLPPPWRALADDLTLVVRDERGTYWAHPWPTWSRFFGEEARGEGGRWDVQRAVPLRAIVFLEQGEKDRAEPVGPGHAVCLLTELARQTATYLLRDRPLEEIGAFNLQRFENLCALARAVPASMLHVSLDGAFWEEIERAIR